MDENTKHIVASNLTAAFYSGYVRETEYKTADGLTYTIMQTYAGFLARLDRLDDDESSSDAGSASPDGGT